MKKTMLIGTVLVAFAGGCCSSCNAIEECFGKKDDATTSATCSHCGGTSCSRSCSAGAEQSTAGNKLVHSCTLDAKAQRTRAAELKETVFSKAKAIVPLENGYTFQFQEPEAFVGTLEEVAAFERKCCAVYQWEVRKTAKGQELTVTGDGAVAEIGDGLRALGWMPQ